MKNKIKTDGVIKDGKIVFYDPKYSDRLTKFKADHEGASVSIAIEIIDSWQHWQFEYLYGYVYTAIAMGMGHVHENGLADVDAVDRILKEQFLLFEISDEKDIPAHHRKNIKIYIKDEYSHPELLPHGCQIFYMPSKSSLTYDELSHYIKQCEAVRDDLDGWHYEDWQGAVTARKKAFQ